MMTETKVTYKISMDVKAKIDTTDSTDVQLMDKPIIKSNTNDEEKVVSTFVDYRNKLPFSDCKLNSTDGESFYFHRYILYKCKSKAIRDMIELEKDNKESTIEFPASSSNLNWILNCVNWSANNESETQIEIEFKKYKWETIFEYIETMFKWGFDNTLNDCYDAMLYKPLPWPIVKILELGNKYKIDYHLINTVGQWLFYVERLKLSEMKMDEVIIGENTPSEFWNKVYNKCMEQMNHQLYRPSNKNEISDEILKCIGVLILLIIPYHTNLSDESVDSIIKIIVKVSQSYRDSNHTIMNIISNLPYCGESQDFIAGIVGELMGVRIINTSKI